MGQDYDFSTGKQQQPPPPPPHWSRMLWRWLESSASSVAHSINTNSSSAAAAAAAGDEGARGGGAVVSNVRRRQLKPRASTSASAVDDASSSSADEFQQNNGNRQSAPAGGISSRSSRQLLRNSGSGRNHPQHHQPSPSLSISSNTNSNNSRKKTLVLDLDETLIHSTSRGARNYDHVIEVLIDKHVCLYYVYKRPHVDYFLSIVCQWYRVVVFTASMAEYADPVIDLLDAKRNIFDSRLFRQSCTQVNGAFLKNLAVIEPDLSQICLVDNSPISYACNQDNGIPIAGWTNDKNDVALLDLLPFLDALRFCHDVRSILSLRI